MNVLTLCTGNVSRSVWLGAMLSRLSDEQGFAWGIRTAGTHAVEGMAISARTRDALTRIEEFADAQITRHRSHQVTPEDIEWADLILCFEVNHVNYVRRETPAASDKAVLLRQLVRDLPLDGPDSERLAMVARLQPDAECETADPAGGDQPVYDVTAQEVWDLAQALVTVLGED